MEWGDIIDPLWEQELGERIRERLASAPAHYPPAGEIFRAFELTPLDQVSVVIIGQDPYHGQGQADGLAFSVKAGQKMPPSLRNIWKELQTEYGIAPEVDGAGKPIGSLEGWARQGVLLLNTALTVAPGDAGSHANIGWHEFADDIIRGLQQLPGHVYLLWGQHAQRKQALIDGDKHVIIACAHPSPFSAYRGFFGSDCFRKANKALNNLGREQIQWSKHV